MSVLQRLARWRVRLGYATAVVAMVFAAPTWTSWAVGLVIALAGEALRIWAAGHLEKSREVTQSGPYRILPHPLYVGSAVLALGAVVACGSVVVAVVTTAYMALTITAAVRTEEAFLRQAFGSAYDEYRSARSEPVHRAFSLARVRRNREHRAVIGLSAGFTLLALRVLLSL